MRGRNLEEENSAVKTNGKANGNHQSACEEWNTKDEDDDFDKALDQEWQSMCEEAKNRKDDPNKKYAVLPPDWFEPELVVARRRRRSRKG